MKKIASSYDYDDLIVSGEQSLKERFQGRRNSPRAKMLTT